jgi:hypothetical protein
MDFPNVGSLPVTVWTGGRYGPFVAQREVLVGASQYVSAAWGTANLACYQPIWLPMRYPVKNMFVYNFATVAGNVDIGIYNKEGARLASAGTTAMAGASTMQFFAADLILDPGQYYLAFVSSSTTATFACCNPGTATRARYLGLLGQATALPLPANATFAANTINRYPAVGITYLSGTPSF